MQTPVNTAQAQPEALNPAATQKVQGESAQLAALRLRVAHADLMYGVRKGTVTEDQFQDWMNMRTDAKLAILLRPIGA